MKLRYYMRGLGIGIIVTAILMSVTLHGKTRPMTDEQVMERARQLGMEEKYDTSVLADSLSENHADPMAATEKETESKTPAAEPKKDADEQQAAEPKKDADEQQATEPKKDADEQQEDTADQKAQDAIDRAQQGRQDAMDAADKALQDAKKGADEASKIKNGDEKTADQKDAPAKTGTKKDFEITVSGGDDSYRIAKKLEAAGMIDDSAAFDDYLCQNGLDRKITTGKHVIRAGATKEEIAKELTTKVTK